MNVKVYTYEDSCHNPYLIRDSESIIIDELSKVNNLKNNEERKQLLSKIDFNKTCIINKIRIITWLS